MVNWHAAAAIALPFVGGFGGALFTGEKQLKGWYRTLNKPPWTPPNWLFGPVWTVLYAGMGYASYRVFDALGGFSEDSKIPLGLYGAQLLLNWVWTPIFFGAHKLRLALADILAVDALAAATAVSFYKVDEVAGLLFVPYLIWLALATSISAWVWIKNDEDHKKE